MRRFDFDVSPPPPPPVSLAAYEKLVAQDPNGFEMVRARLEDVFPRLSDVATSSIGASVGAYIADYDMTQEQLTKAYLSSRGMTPDSLGARVIEARHTGRWRPACAEMHKLFDDQTKAAAGRLSKAARLGNPHYDDSSYTGTTDRNLFLYAMLEIQMSIGRSSIQHASVSTFELYDMICGRGVGGYRVPTDSKRRNTYEFQAGYEIDTFAPLIMYGSLETVRAARMTYLNMCQLGFAAEDVALQLYCYGAGSFGTERKVYLLKDLLHRLFYAPFVTHRDRYCAPNEFISVEDALARPETFTKALYDSYSRSKYGVNSLVVPAESRGEERMLPTHAAYSLRSWVYITSSSDPSIRPGMHRLLDLPVFANGGCNAMPGANCAPPGGGYHTLRPSSLAAAAAYDATATYYAGRMMLAKTRCSMLINQHFAEAPMCVQTPYALHALDPMRRCWQHNLELSLEPKLYASKEWMSELTAPPPMPPPTSPSPPPLPATPPPPRDPSPPPYVQPQELLMQRIRDMEERACTSVYYLTTATRCDRLAVELSESVLYEALAPPSPPPGAPVVASPRAPPPPPSPHAPPGYVIAPVASARLSTMRVPSVAAAAATPLVVAGDGYYMTPSELAAAKLELANAGAALPLGALVRCTTWQEAAPLPCVSSALEDACIPGLRGCASVAENTESPFLELVLSGAPRRRGNRLFGIEFRLPDNADLAALFFRSAEPEPVGGAGYTVQVYRADGSTIQCLSQAEQSGAQAVTDDRTVQHLCAGGGATDAQLYALDEAHRIRVTLPGAYRQIWLRDVRVTEVSLRAIASALADRPPFPPPLPGLPPYPPSPPPAACSTFEARTFYADRTVVRREPHCGQTADECCAHAREAGAPTNAYELSDTGCCTLVTVAGTGALDTGRWGFLTPTAGTGRV